MSESEIWDRAPHHVALDDVYGYIVSTADLTFCGRIPPVGAYRFETMVFRGGNIDDDVYCDRYETLEDAEAGHLRVVANVRTGVIR